MERYSLKTKQIRCPYCRNVQSTLLPYHKMSGVTKIHGVNYYDDKSGLLDEYKNSKYSSSEYVKGNCCFSFSSKDTDGNDVITNCSNKYVKFLSYDSKTYCLVHRLNVLKKYMAEKKEKEKENKKKKRI